MVAKDRVFLCNSDAVFGKGGDDEQSPSFQGLFQFRLHPGFESSRQSDDEGLRSFQQVGQHILFQDTMKAADDAISRCALSNRPVITFQNYRRRSWVVS